MAVHANHDVVGEVSAALNHFSCWLNYNFFGVADVGKREFDIEQQSGDGHNNDSCYHEQVLKNSIHEKYEVRFKVRGSEMATRVNGWLKESGGGSSLYWWRLGVF